MTIDDIRICPKCKSDNTYEYNTDEIEFDHTGNGHYYVDCHCQNCGHNFRLYMNFEYKVTNSHCKI